MSEAGREVVERRAPPALRLDASYARYPGAFVRRATVGGVTAFALPFVLWLVLPAPVPPPFDALLAALSAVALVGGLTALVLAAVRRRAGPAEPAALETDGAALRVLREGTVRYATRADAIEAHHASPDGAHYSLRLRGGDVLLLRFARKEQGDALRDALGLDVPLERLRMGSPAARLFGGASAFLALWCGLSSLLLTTNGLVGGMAALAGVTLLSGAATAGLLALFRAPEFTVGREGLALRFSVWRFFVPYARLEGISLGEPQHIELRLAGGRRERFYASARPELREQLVRSVTRALEAYRARARGAALPALERGDREVPAWQTAVRVAVEAGAGYRSEQLDAARLLAALEDDSARAEQRVGAALALLELGDPRSRARVRAVARSCASEPLRQALLRAADGALRDEDLEAALHDERARRVL